MSATTLIPGSPRKPSDCWSVCRHRLPHLLLPEPTLLGHPVDLDRGVRR
ncbi:MAG: hypothetical protein ACRDP8_07160 [Actinopolymorphaceae bacterium]